LRKRMADFFIVAPAPLAPPGAVKLRIGNTAVRGLSTSVAGPRSASNRPCHSGPDQARSRRGPACSDPGAEGCIHAEKGIHSALVFRADARCERGDAP
jgi:hypothetical protein